MFVFMTSAYSSEWWGQNAHATACIWRSEDNLSKLVLFFLHMSSMNQAQVVPSGNTPPNLLSHFTDPSRPFLLESQIHKV